MYIHKIVVILPLPPCETPQLHYKHRALREKEKMIAARTGETTKTKKYLKVQANRVAPISHFVVLINLFRCFWTEMKRKISSGIISLLMLPIHLLLDFIQLFSVCFGKWFCLDFADFTFANLTSSFVLLLSLYRWGCLMKCNLMMTSKPIWRL